MGGLVARRNRFSQRRLSGPSSQLTRPNKSVRLPSTGFTILPFVSPLPPRPFRLNRPLPASAPSGFTVINARTHVAPIGFNIFHSHAPLPDLPLNHFKPILPF